MYETNKQKLYLIHIIDANAHVKHCFKFINVFSTKDVQNIIKMIGDLQSSEYQYEINIIVQHIKVVAYKTRKKSSVK